MAGEFEDQVGYWCEHCLNFILAQLGKFEHPDLGICTCAICRKCGGMVYQRVQEYA